MNFVGIRTSDMGDVHAFKLYSIFPGGELHAETQNQVVVVYVAATTTAATLVPVPFLNCQGARGRAW